MPPRILILRAPGTNCDVETAHAFELAGGAPSRVHVNRLLEDPKLADEFQILCIPGGFSYGDDIAAGKILAAQIEHHLANALAEFKDAGKLILGICNGFQVLIKSGILLPAANGGLRAATLTWNDSHKFEDRWVNLTAVGDKCVCLRGIEAMYLPIAHAEGKFVARDEETLQTLDQAGQLVLRYAVREPVAQGSGPSQSAIRNPQSAIPYPANPNGSQANVAGVCDETGRVFGLMPHPERHLDRTNHPRWTRGEGADPGDGLALFRNAVEYFA